jgi:hypothetical protein
VTYVINGFFPIKISLDAFLKPALGVDITTQKY